MAGFTAPEWLDGFGDWSWPGLKPAVELTPASWVPALPLIEAPAAPVRVVIPRRRTPRPLRLARLAVLVAVAGATFVLSNELLRRAPVAFGGGSPRIAATATITDPFSTAAAAPRTTAAGKPAPALPRPVTVSADASGGAIAAISYRSAALHRSDRFLVYLPPGYRAGARSRYPVLYLLHGYGQPANSFLRLGVASTLDALIGAHTIRPLIAVMLQGANVPDNWLDSPGAHFYGYVGEVQRLVDRVLPTIPDRSARAIAGYSMGGFGAMNVALRQLRSYSVVESWEGQFANLRPVLEADRSLLRWLPLQAFVWGGAQDTVVPTKLDRPWAAAMRGEGVNAWSAVFPGAHAFAPIERHLRSMLSFAGRALRS